MNQKNDPVLCKVSVYITEKDEANLKKLCETMGQKKSEVFRNLLKEEIEELLGERRQ